MGIFPCSPKGKDPFCFQIFEYALSRVPGYVKCMESYGINWLGLRFIFPLIWWPTIDYKGTYRMTKKAKRDYWGALITSNGFLQPKEVPESSFNLTNFHRRCLESDLDSD